MLSKSLLAKNLLQRSSTIMGSSVASRGVYTDETRPYVFINEHTKVICQGMTGKHVSTHPDQQSGTDKNLYPAYANLCNRFCLCKTRNSDPYAPSHFT